MFYTIAEAAKAMGLEKSIILRAIEDGQITANQNDSGEWLVEETELHSLYLSFAQDYCKSQWQADLGRDHERSQSPEIANIADNDEGGISQELTETRTKPDQAEIDPSTPTKASTSQNEIRIDDRDRIYASALCPAFRPTRTHFIIVLLAFGCIGALSSFYFSGRSRAPEQNAISSNLVPASEKASIPPVTLATGSGENNRNIRSATGNAADHSSNSAKNLSQTPTPPPAVTKQDAASSDTATKKGQAKAVRKLLPVPETRPTTVEGWTVRNVANGIATLEGPGGTWKAARGDTLPGLGRVESVVLWGNRWIVATTKGLISTP